MNTKHLFSASLLPALLLVSSVSFGQDRVLSTNEIPSEIANYVKNNFADKTITLAKIDEDDRFVEYEIKLDDRTELEFDHEFEIRKIESHSALPNSVVPKEIAAYVSANYPNNHIRQWELEWKHQEVELDSGIELEFNRKGEFLRVDH